MADRKLGKGFSELFEKSQQRFNLSGFEATEVAVADISPNPHQPRKLVEDESFQELCDSIEKNGLLQPILVRRRDSSYDIIAGERRWRAFRRLGREVIPCVVVGATDTEMLAMAIVENLQREDFTPLEKAKLFKKFMEMGRTEGEIAQRVGVTKAAVSQVMSILKLGQVTQTRVVETRRGRPRAFGQIGLYQSYVIVAYTKDMSVLI